MKKILIFTFLFVFVFTITTGECRNNHYTNLKHSLFNKIKKLPGLQGIAFKDFQTKETFFISGNMLFPAASVIKLPIMAAVFCEAARGRLNLNQRLTLYNFYKLGGSGILKSSPSGRKYTISELVDLMITKSDNTATYMLINKLGLARLRKHMRALRLTRTYLRDKTLLAEGPGHWQNLTTPADTLRLLDLIYRGKIANQRYCKEMINIMKRQKYTWGIARKLPLEAIVANKTGFQTGVLNDAGIVFAEKGDYALVIFVSGIRNMYAERKIINDISCRVYETFMKRHP